jgi:hypothetical protein
MKTAKLSKLSRRVVAAEGLAISERWCWGREVLADPAFVNSAGTLRRGKGIAKILIAIERAEGGTLSESEIQYRLKCARAYPTEGAISHARGLYGTWTALRDAGFPPVEVVEPEPAPVTPEQGTFDELLPGALVVDGEIKPLAVAPVRSLDAYADELVRMAEVASSRAAACRKWVDELIAAADGDMDLTYIEARDRARARAEGGVSRDCS